MAKKSPATDYQYNDVHFHVSNFAQNGIKLPMVLNMMDKFGVDKMAVFGFPLQQKWNVAANPQKSDLLLHTDDTLYYYSAVDSVIAREYLALNHTDQQRFYPMINGFNPTDGYAVEHVKKMLTLYPGVFSGIGEFSINKELVSPKIDGAHASLKNPALDKLLDFAAEVGLIVLLHNDIDSIESSHMPQVPARYLKDLDALLSRHKNATIIWAHAGLGRFVKPNKDHLNNLAILLNKYPNLYYDISWNALLKYIFKNQFTLEQWALLINQYPDRFVFGTDALTPSLRTYQHLIRAYLPLWPHLTQATQEKVKKGNFAKLFGGAQQRVRAWEKAHINNLSPTINWPLAANN